jgi:hypothetical protein
LLAINSYGLAQLTLPQKTKSTKKVSAATNIRFLFDTPGMQLVTFLPKTDPVPPPIIGVMPETIATSIC